MDFQKIKEKIVDEAKKITSYDDLILIDKKILIPFVITLVIFLFGYYYLLFGKFWHMDTQSKDNVNNSKIIDTIPGKSKENIEINAAINDFINLVMAKDYDKILSLLDQSFVSENNINIEIVTNYFETQYPTQISYNVSKVMYNKVSDDYVVVLKFKKPDPNSDVYYKIFDSEINYYLKKVNGQYQFYIPNIPENEYYSSNSKD